MIKRLIALIASLLVFGALATPAEAGNRHRFVVGIETPVQLAGLIQQSLEKDKSGKSAVSAESCSKRACATPADYLAMFAESDPEAGLTSVNQLPEYVRALVIRKAPPGRYWMACKTGNGSAASKPMWNCLARAFHAGETAFVNPKTGRIVLARDCTNPVGKEDVPVRCVEKHVFLKEGDEFHSGWLGPDAFPQGNCIPAILKAGETEWSNTHLDECPRDQCDWSGPARDLGGVKVWSNPRISFVAERTGEYIIRLPVEVTKVSSVFVDCVVRPDGRQTLGNVIRPQSYGSQGKAYLTYKDQTFSRPPAEWHGTPHPWMFADGASD